MQDDTVDESQKHALLSLYIFFRMVKTQCQGTLGCTPNSVPMVFIVFSRDSWGI